MDFCAARQRTEHVDVTARTAKVRSSSRKFYGAQQIRDFCEQNERRAWRHTAVAYSVRHSRNLLVRRETQRSMSVLKQRVRQEWTTHAIFLLRTTSSKDGAAHRSKAPTANGSFNVR